MVPGSPPELILLALSDLTRPWGSASQLTCWLRAGLSGRNTTAGASREPRPGHPPHLLSHALSPLPQVPLCACSLCSTRECLYMLSSHDIEHHPAYRDLPASKAVGTPEPSLGAGAPQDPGGVAWACEEYLSQIHNCPTLQDRMEKMKEIVGWMPLMAAQKDFFWEALDMLQRAAGGAGQGPPPPES